MTRNILNWRNDPEPASLEDKKTKTLAYRLDDTPKRSGADEDSSE
jgi:hypothetical protein